MTLAELLEEAKHRLSNSGLASPEVDAELLTAHLLGLSRGELISEVHRGLPPPPALQRQLWDLVTRRITREPLQHIVGRAPFMSLELEVGPGVFIPRPETESMVERAISSMSTTTDPGSQLKIADLCSGSGAIALALAKGFPRAEISAVEISPAAISYLKRNIASEQEKISVESRSVSSWAALADASSFDLIIANPPYIPHSQVPNDPEVRDFDPKEALYAGIDGLDSIREIAFLSLALLKTGGILLLEHSNLQGRSSREILEETGFVGVTTGKDMGGRDRFVEGYRS